MKRITELKAEKKLSILRMPEIKSFSSYQQYEDNNKNCKTALKYGIQSQKFFNNGIVCAGFLHRTA